MEIDKIEEAVNWLKNRITGPEIGLILGSGLGGLVDKIEEKLVIPYEEIPNFPTSTVESHAGSLISGRLFGRNVLIMDGRLHYYEGYSLKEVVRPIRIMGLLGIEKLIITNACGGINRTFTPGDFMFISDHINFPGQNPLRGINLDELGSRFPDMSQAYNQELIKVGEEVAAELNLITRRGVYGWYQGPSFETPAEIRMYEKNGADVVGMSTVPEVIAANHMGIKVLGISCITNMAAGILSKPLSSEEVYETARRVAPQFRSLVSGIIKKL